MEVSWGVVVPVKQLSLAKSRLSSYGDDARQALALAFAADVVSTALHAPGVAEVLVVTDDREAAALLTSLGARVVRDDPDAGLNPALEHGADLLRTGAAHRGVVTVSADLPAFQATDLAGALRQVGPQQRGFVPDAAGTGTTVLAAGPGALLLPSFGPRSAASHLASGATELTAAPGLRRDVDTPQDLQAALALGVGPHTTRAAAALPGRSVQATVRIWVPVQGGSALLDDGSAITLPPDALVDSIFRFLRPGQRVQLHLAGGRVVRLGLPGSC